jgi:hypothetical protein
MASKLTPSAHHCARLPGCAAAGALARVRAPAWLRCSSPACANSAISSRARSPLGRLKTRQPRRHPRRHRRTVTVTVTSPSVCCLRIQDSPATDNSVDSVHATPAARCRQFLQMHRRKAIQLILPAPPTWGGRREGAGRKPVGRWPGPSHGPRPQHSERHPVHLTLRVGRDIPSLRGDCTFPPARSWLAQNGWMKAGGPIDVREHPVLS